MPTNASDLIDGDTASQTARTPRGVVNAAGAKPAKDVKQTAQAAPVEMETPAIDATTFAAADAVATGEGGPLIATASGGTPVTSKLINGEPVVVLRLRPSLSASSGAPIETAVAMPSDTPQFTEPAPAPVAPPPSKLALRPTAPVRSPQMIITDVPVRPTFPATPTRVAQVAAPTLEKPKTKPVAEKPAADKPTVTAINVKPVPVALAKSSEATGAPRKPPVPTAAYEPPEDAAFAGSVPVQTASDVPEPAATQEPASAFTTPEPTPAAPSPLIPMQQE
jgi:hypothetical protein